MLYFLIAIIIVTFLYLFFKDSRKNKVINKGGMRLRLKTSNQNNFQKWKQLAEQGDMVSQYNFGLMYFRGDGVSQDYKEAAKWFKLAATQGLQEAQKALAGMYGEGLGVPRDSLMADQWLAVAAGIAKPENVERDVDIRRKEIIKSFHSS